jgi:hypothetical protein
MVLAAAALVFWRLRRGKRAASEAWAQAACPACIGLNLVAERALAGLRPDPLGQPDDGRFRLYTSPEPEPDHRPRSGSPRCRGKGAERLLL